MIHQMANPTPPSVELLCVLQRPENLIPEGTSRAERRKAMADAIDAYVPSACERINESTADLREAGLIGLFDAPETMRLMMILTVRADPTRLEQAREALNALGEFAAVMRADTPVHIITESAPDSDLSV
jgi:hypothetical protein